MTDAVARIGGDEFVTLASFKNQAEITAKLAELQNHFQQFTIELNGKSISASASIGYAVFSIPPDTLDTVLAAGDAAMYQAKLQRKSLASAEVNTLGSVLTNNSPNTLNAKDQIQLLHTTFYHWYQTSRINSNNSFCRFCRLSISNNNSIRCFCSSSR